MIVACLWFLEYNKQLAEAFQKRRSNMKKKYKFCHFGTWTCYSKMGCGPIFTIIWTRSTEYIGYFPPCNKAVAVSQDQHFHLAWSICEWYFATFGNCKSSPWTTRYLCQVVSIWVLDFTEKTGQSLGLDLVSDIKHHSIISTEIQMMV